MTEQTATKMAEWKAYLDRYDMEGERFTAAEAIEILQSFLQGQDFTVSRPEERRYSICIKNAAGDSLTVDYDNIAEEFSWGFAYFGSHAGLDRDSFWRMLRDLYGILSGTTCTVTLFHEGKWLCSWLEESERVHSREMMKAVLLEALERDREFEKSYREFFERHRELAKEYQGNASPILKLMESPDWQGFQMRLSFFDSRRDRSEFFSPQELGIE